MLTERDRCHVTFTQPDVLRNTLTCTRVNSQSQWIQRATVQKLCSRVTMGTTYRPPTPPPPPSNSPPNKCLCQSLMKTLQFWCLEQTVWEDGKGTPEPSSSAEALTSLNRWTQSLKERNQHRATTRQTTVVLYRRTAAAAAQVCEG